MAISTDGVGYKFLPPVIRHDPNATSGTAADTSRSSMARTANVPVVVPSVPTPDTTVEHTAAGAHLLRIMV